MTAVKNAEGAMDRNESAEIEKRVAKAGEAMRVGLEKSGMSGKLLEQAVERFTEQRRRIIVFEARMKSLIDTLAVPKFLVNALYCQARKSYGLARRRSGPALASRMAAYAAALVRDGVPEEAVQAVMERSWEILTKAEAGKDSEMLRKCLRDSLQPA